MQALGLEGRYQLIPILPMPEGETALREQLDRLRRGELDGLNVTIPHKQAVIPWVDELTPVAKEVNAVNTLIRSKGRLVGDNTDVPGFLADLRLCGVDGEAGAACLVLGAGGAARAVAYALAHLGWQVTVAARNTEAAQPFTRWQCRVVALTREAIQPALPGCRLIVNATPVGMHPYPQGSPWPVDLAFPQGAFVYDLVYNPQNTRLVRQAGEAGLAANSGIGMLVEQGALSFERWLGQVPSRQAMRQAIFRAQET